MRRLCLLSLLIYSFPLAAQTVESERQTLQVLLAEVQQLRLAIERSTLLGTRTQIAMQRIQVQENRTARLSRDLEEVRKEIGEMETEQPRVAARTKDREDRAAQLTDLLARRELESEVKQLKLDQEQLAGIPQRRRVREQELASQLQAEQRRLEELHDRSNEMERALDAAIRQMTGQR